MKGEFGSFAKVNLNHFSRLGNEWRKQQWSPGIHAPFRICHTLFNSIYGIECIKLFSFHRLFIISATIDNLAAKFIISMIYLC